MNEKAPPIQRGSVVANCALATGCLLAISFYSSGFSLLAWIALAPLGVVLSTKKMTLRCWAGIYLGGLIFHLWALDWIRTLYGGFALEGNYAPGWLICGQLGAVIFCLMILAGRRLVLTSKLPVTLALPFAWYFYETMQSLLMMAFDQHAMRYLSLAHTQADYPLISQIADLGGELTVSLLVALVNGFIYDLHFVRIDLPFRKWDWNLVARCVGVPIIFTGSISYGYFRMHQPVQETGPNICLMTRHDLPPLIKPDRLPSADKTDLYVWPELAYHHAIIDAQSSAQKEATIAAHWPLTRGDVEGYRHRISDYLQQTAQNLNANLLIGVERLSAEDDQISTFNSLAYVHPEAGVVGTYDKVHCAPFREFAPAHWEWLQIAVPVEYSRGKSPTTFALSTSTGDELTFGCGLCYEVAFPDHFQQQMENSQLDFFVLAGSEASDSTGVLAKTLLRMAQLRAIETRRPIVRNAHRGYSGWIDSCGRIVSVSDRNELAQPRALTPTQLDARISYYAQWGDWLSPLMISLFAVALILPNVQQLMKSLRTIGTGTTSPKFPPPVRRARGSGFSLFELMAVVAILSTIAILILPRVTGATDAAKERADKMNIALLNSAAERWYLDKGAWPAINLSDIGADPNYLPEGIPVSPHTGKAYKLNSFTMRVNSTGGGGK